MKKYLFIVSLLSLNMCCMDNHNKTHIEDINNDYLFQAVKSINDIVKSTVQQMLDDKELTDAQISDDLSVHPSFKRTKKGILLECHDNKVPAELWTPWGIVTLLGPVTGKTDLICKKIKEKIRLSKYTGYQPAKWMDGKTYYIDAIDGFEDLPKATLKKRNQYNTDDHTVFEAWHRLKQASTAISGKQ